MSELEELSCEELVKKLVNLASTGADEEVDEVLDWLLFTYSPEHSFALVQENADALTDPAFVDFVLTKARFSLDKAIWAAIGSWFSNPLFWAPFAPGIYKLQYLNPFYLL